MARQIIKTTIETIETTGFALKQRHRIETKASHRNKYIITKVVSIVSIVVKKESCKDMFF